MLAVECNVVKLFRNEDFGRKLKELRKKAGMTQTDVAREVDVATSTVSRWEDATIPPKPEDLAGLCRLFEVSEDVFYFDPEVSLGPAMLRLVEAAAPLDDADVVRYANLIAAEAAAKAGSTLLDEQVGSGEKAEGLSKQKARS